jgi:hypothetical protein
MVNDPAPGLEPSVALLVNSTPYSGLPVTVALFNVKLPFPSMRAVDEYAFETKLPPFTMMALPSPSTENSAPLYSVFDAETLFSVTEPPRAAAAAWLYDKRAPDPFVTPKYVVERVVPVALIEEPSPDANKSSVPMLAVVIDPPVIVTDAPDAEDVLGPYASTAAPIPLMSSLETSPYCPE